MAQEAAFLRFLYAVSQGTSRSGHPRKNVAACSSPDEISLNFTSVTFVLQSASLWVHLVVIFLTDVSLGTVVPETLFQTREQLF